MSPLPGAEAGKGRRHRQLLAHLLDLALRQLVFEVHLERGELRVEPRAQLQAFAHGAADSGSNRPVGLRAQSAARRRSATSRFSRSGRSQGTSFWSSLCRQGVKSRW